MACPPKHETKLIQFPYLEKRIGDRMSLQNRSPDCSACSSHSGDIGMLVNDSSARPPGPLHLWRPCPPHAGEGREGASVVTGPVKPGDDSTEIGQSNRKML